ncbi:hypothetical protein BU14_0219s0005 [Porphyra umbilicalis]|uniref:Uncharacterized protein n=1 Tax=Porphyra umbilicalis TaxID=2786 RepID=A0A1X6P4X3_PORUM|nr:hypothetical protein BU14_0219s0005 [Porphyra umbilicalis]|eukprot:OSX75805.1 hypothetical protein BU14_0219s0005 [Porphyra umbilicalis]
MATGQTLRAASAVASAEPANDVSTTGNGTFLVSPRAAVQAMVDNLVANEEFLERPTRDPAGPSAGDGIDTGTWFDSTGSTCEDGPTDRDVREEGPAQDPPPAGDRASKNWSVLDALVTAAALSTAAPAVAGATGSGQAGDPKAASVGPSKAIAGSALVGGNGGGSATPNPPEGSTGAGRPHGDVAAAASRVAKPPVQLCLGMGKGGRTSTVKAFLGSSNQQQPASVGNSIVLGVFPCKTDDHAALESICAVWLADIEELRANGIKVCGETRAVMVILTGDYKWMSAFLGHFGPGAGVPYFLCTAVARPTLTNAAIVKEFGCLQDGSRCTGRRRHVAHALRMSARYAAGPNASLARQRSLRRHLSLERRPLMVLAACDIAPTPLHLTLGTTVASLQLALEAVTCSFGEAPGHKLCASMGEILRRDAGVSPASGAGIHGIVVGIEIRGQAESGHLSQGALMWPPQRTRGSCWSVCEGGVRGTGSPFGRARGAFKMAGAGRP